MEIANHALKLRRNFTHSGLSHAELSSLEWFVEIMCAMANVPLVCPFHTRPPAGLAPRKELYHLRLDFFAGLYSKRRLHPPLIDFSQRAARIAMQPPDSLLALWDLLIKNVPSKLEFIEARFRERAQHILHHVSGDEYCSKELNYSKATWMHNCPDRRAAALVHAHYVLLVQLCAKPRHTGRVELFVQALVHTSMRNGLTHYARISVWQTLQDEQFSLLSARCTCEDGFVL